MLKHTEFDRGCFRDLGAEYQSQAPLFDPSNTLLDSVLVRALGKMSFVSYSVAENGNLLENHC